MVEREVLVTPARAKAERWNVQVHCAWCGYDRAPLGPPPPAPDRNLILALWTGRLVCFKCRRPSQLLTVSRYENHGVSPLMRVDGHRIVLTEGVHLKSWPTIGGAFEVP